MFQAGELIVYGNTGVCRIEAVGRPEQISCADRDALYYTLAPLYSSEVIYAPLDTPVRMRRVLTREAAEQLISQIPSILPAGGEGAPQQMADRYRGLIETHRCEDLLQLIKTLYLKGQAALHHGRKPGQVDQRFRKRAEDLLYGELAVALEIPRESVEDYITERMSRLERPV